MKHFGILVPVLICLGLTLPVSSTPTKSRPPTQPEAASASLLSVEDVSGASSQTKRIIDPAPAIPIKKTRDAEVHWGWASLSLVVIAILFFSGLRYYRKSHQKILDSQDEQPSPSTPVTAVWADDR